MWFGRTGRSAGAETDVGGDAEAVIEVTGDPPGELAFATAHVETLGKVLTSLPVREGKAAVEVPTVFIAGALSRSQRRCSAVTRDRSRAGSRLSGRLAARRATGRLARRLAVGLRRLLLHRRGAGSRTALGRRRIGALGTGSCACEKRHESEGSKASGRAASRRNRRQVREEHLPRLGRLCARSSSGARRNGASFSRIYRQRRRLSSGRVQTPQKEPERATIIAAASIK